MKNVKNNYGFKGTIKGAILHEIDSSTGYYDGDIESLKSKVRRITVLMAAFMASHIKDAKQLNEIIGWDQYEDD